MSLDEVAMRYADEFTSSEDLIEKARARLASRLRHAATGSCSVCGAPLVARRADTDTCSSRCRATKFRSRHVYT